MHERVSLPYLITCTRTRHLRDLKWSIPVLDPSISVKGRNQIVEASTLCAWLPNISTGTPCFHFKLGINYTHIAMPKEQIRKRGKRKPKGEEQYSLKPVEAPAPHVSEPRVEPTPFAGPSVIPPAAVAVAAGGVHPDRIALLNGKRPPPAAPRPPQGDATTNQPQGEEEGTIPWAREPMINPDFPFGELDPDLKGYFRTVEDQIKDWEGSSSVGEEREGRFTRPDAPGSGMRLIF